MGKNLLISFTALVLILSIGCAGRKPLPEGYEATYPEPVTSTKPIDGAIYSQQQAVQLFTDRRARREGDLITVILDESTSADKASETSTSKQTDVNVDNPTLFGLALPTDKLGEELDDVTLDQLLSSQQSFSGQGGAQQSNNLAGTITVTVAQVLPNGNLMLRGQKLMSLNEGNEYIQLSGIVRPDDVSANNTVLSTQIADASITYKGKGPVANSGKMGWLARFFTSPWWPY